MSAPSGEHPLIQQAKAALRRLAEVPLTEHEAAPALEAIEAGAERAPLSIGIGGEDIADRTRFVDFLSGGLFDGHPRLPSAAPLRVRRGQVNRFRAIADGEVQEEQVMPVGQHPELEAPVLERIELARSMLAASDAVVETAERSLPALLRTPPPPIWKFWLWPVRLILWLMSRKQVDNHRHALAARAESQKKVASIEGELAGVQALARRERAGFTGRLRELSSGEGAGERIREVELELADGPLVDGIELVELGVTLHAPPSVDAVLVVENGAVQALGRDGTVTVGAVADAVHELAHIARTARILRLVRRALATIDAAGLSLDIAIDRATAEFQRRLEAIEHHRIPDRSEFANAQLARLGPQIGASVHAVMEHATAHLGSELAQLGEQWKAAIRATTSSDELKAAVQKIDQTQPGELKRIAEEVRLLVMGGIGGSAYDLFPELITSLREQGLSAQLAQAPRNAPVLPQVEILPSLANPSPSSVGGPGRFAGIFRSLDGLRTEMVDKVRQRANHVREVAMAELLDAEPRMRNVLRDALGVELDTGMDRQIASIERALADEQNAIARERAALVPLKHLREAVRADANHLQQQLGQIEAASPAAAAAAAP